MSPSLHIVPAAASAAVLYPVDGEAAIPFGLSVILIDLDRLISCPWDTGDWTLRGFFVYHRILLRNLHTGFLGLSAFPTVEFNPLCLLLTLWQPLFCAVLAGCLFHHLFDLINLVRMGHPFCKPFTVTDYVLRRKGRLVSVRDVLSHPAVDLEGIPDIAEWAARWEAAAPERRP